MGLTENLSENRNNEILTPGAITSFPDLQSVVAFLKRESFRASRSMIYRHHAERKIRSAKDGTYPLSIVQKYAAKFLRLIDGERMRSSGSNDLQERKLRAEIDKLESHARAAAIRADAMTGNFIERAHHEAELARRASFLKNDLIQFWHQKAADVCALVNGDPGKVQDLIYFGIEAVEDWISRYSVEGISWPLQGLSTNQKVVSNEAEEDEEGADD